MATQVQAAAAKRRIAQLAAIEQADAILKTAEDQQVKRINEALSRSFSDLKKDIETRWPKYQSGDTFATDRALLLTSELKAVLNVLDPKNKRTKEIKRQFSELLKLSDRNGNELADQILSTYSDSRGIAVDSTTSISTDVLAEVTQEAYDRLLKYGSQFAEESSIIVQQGIIQGWPVGKTTKALASRLGVGASRAEMIVRTESGKGANRAAKKRYEKEGVELVQWIATQDSRTCEFCASRAGNIYKASEVDGILHPNDRCRLTPIKEEWIEAGLVDLEWAEKHHLDAVAKAGGENTGAAPFERSAGIKAPKPWWKPGQKIERKVEPVDTLESRVVPARIENGIVVNSLEEAIQAPDDWKADLTGFNFKRGLKPAKNAYQRFVPDVEQYTKMSLDEFEQRAKKGGVYQKEPKLQPEGEVWPSAFAWAKKPKTFIGTGLNEGYSINDTIAFYKKMLKNLPPKELHQRFLADLDKELKEGGVLKRSPKSTSPAKKIFTPLPAFDVSKLENIAVEGGGSVDLTRMNRGIKITRQQSPSLREKYEGAIYERPNATDFYNKDAVAKNEKKLLKKQSEKTLNKLQKHVQERLDEGASLVRISSPALEQVIKDGRFKTQFETSSSGGTFNPAYRSMAEYEMFGVTPDTPLEYRPVYGYRSSKISATDEASQYGGLVVKLKQSTEERTTVTMGDSLQNSVIASPLKNVQKGTITNAEDDDIKPRSSYLGKQDDLSKIAKSLDGRYVEIQVHGGLTMDDVEAIYINRPGTTGRFGDRDTLDESSIDRLKKLGVEVRYFEEETNRKDRRKLPDLL